MEDNKDIDDNVVRDFLKQSSGTGFNVPEDYFEGFQKKIHSKIQWDNHWSLILQPSLLYSQKKLTFLSIFHTGLLFLCHTFILNEGIGE